MTPENKTIAENHARAEFPKESCGLLIVEAGKEVYIACKNIAENQIDFIMDPIDFMAAEDRGEILAVVHSHPNSSAKPSQADLVSCEASRLPWHIFSLSTGQWEAIHPTGYRAPLVGRTFAHGVLDCFSLIRDWYLQEKKIELPEFERGQEWWLKGQNLYLENYKKAGFAPIFENEPLEPGDIILMRVLSCVPNHAAIYLGHDRILHHLQNRLSGRDVYGGYWKKITAIVLRHRGATCGT